MTFTRSQYALAASVAALMIAAPMAFHVMKRDTSIHGRHSCFGREASRRTRNERALGFR